jgi:hypothetical protein
MMSIKIGAQYAGVVNNIDGDMHVTGGVYGVNENTAVARKVLADLRTAVASAPLNTGTDSAARREIATMDDSLKPEQLDRSRVAAALNRLTALLSAAGALAHAGAELVTPLRGLAEWLGTLGMPTLSMLG